MLTCSLAVQLAWEIGGLEASNKNSSFIEVDHIMLGILSLDKIAENIRNKSAIDFENFNYEKEKLYEILNAHNINITSFRRNLRKFIPEGNGLPADKVFHRSPDCKQSFMYAAQFANNYLTINHLFLTIIGWETSSARNLLIGDKVDIDKLKSGVMFSFYKNN